MLNRTSFRVSKRLRRILVKTKIQSTVCIESSPTVRLPQEAEAGSPLRTKNQRTPVNIFEHVAICVSDLGASSTAPQAYKSSCQSKPRRIGRISMKVCTTTEHKGLKNSHVLGSRQAWNCYPVPEYSSYQTRGKDRCQGYRLRMDPHVQRIAMGRAVEDRFQVPS